MNKQGIFIVIEGVDGSGKGTQFRLLSERLKNEGYDVETFDFPQYDQPSSYFVTRYLNGAYGSAEEVGPYTASLFYALDRYEAAPRIRDALNEGKVVLANRFTGSNMAHQGTKFKNAEERRGYFIWDDNLEFMMLRIPRPNINFVLRVPAEIAETNIDQKGERSYTDKRRDLHEADHAHLLKTIEVYDDLAQLFPKDFVRIDCVRGNTFLPIDIVQDLLWQKVAPLLPEPTYPRNEASGATELPSPHPTERAAPAPAASAAVHPTEQVYALTASAEAAAAAMSRLQHSSQDIRTIVSDMFNSAQQEDAQLLAHTAADYGERSVEPFISQHLIIEEASNVLMSRLLDSQITFVEQPSRYLAYDKKNAGGTYRYHTPAELDEATKAQYKKHLDHIFELYCAVVRKLAAHLTDTSSIPAERRTEAFTEAIRNQAYDAAQAMMPLAATAAAGIYASGQILEQLIIRLLSDELAEVRQVGERLLAAARVPTPALLASVDSPEQGGAITAYQAQTHAAVERLARHHLPDNHGTETVPVKLTAVWPRNEIDLVPDILYEHSDLALGELQDTVLGWPFNRKLEVFDAYIGERLGRHERPGKVLEKAHYSWEIVCPYGMLRDLASGCITENLAWQQPTPRYGYDVPKIIEDAGAGDDFEAAFDTSLKLYSLLQQAGYQQAAAYATLLGHKLRLTLTHNAREAFRLHEQQSIHRLSYPGYRTLIKQLHDALTQVHPLLGDAMHFVGKANDPELQRRTAERYTQFKLQQLTETPSAPETKKSASS